MKSCPGVLPHTSTGSHQGRPWDNDQDFSPDGPLLGVDDLMADFKCSRRQVHNFLEQGKIKFFKMGRLLRTTQAERDRFVQQLIAEEQQRLEDLTK